MVIIGLSFQIRVRCIASVTNLARLPAGWHR